MSGYDFDKYICGVTGLPCCGCSLFCEHRKDTEEIGGAENEKLR